MTSYRFNFWKKAPFIRLLLATIVGILLQWNLQLPVSIWMIILSVGGTGLLVFFFIPFFKRYKFSFLNGLFTLVLFASIGAMLAWQKDIRNDRQWIGNFYKEKDGLIVALSEPTVEKNKSYKANANVSYLVQGGKAIPVEGKLIIYFKKDSLLPTLSYGTQLIFKKPLQEIKNAGNPGGFDYKRYALFQGITHQVYLKPDEFEILPGKKENRLDKFLYTCRENILSILRKNINGDKELGLAEALLIGYKDDLDQTLVQSYTNTGVVHIIAISGLHLGLIYWLLGLIFRFLKIHRSTRWLYPTLIIADLWLFSLLAGGQPSILRSAVMFTCIVVGENLSKKTSIYNTLALSAFILLCINPYWLWDVGFQLSYSAVLSIIIFMKPIYNWLYIKNKALDAIWKLNAVTIAAQILTIPVSIYHFHQFPVYFLLTNLVAVPLSSAILLGEIFLCAISFIPALASTTGKLIAWLLWLMNTYIERVEKIPYSLWDGLQINMPQAILLFMVTVGVSYWLMEKSKLALKLALFSLLGFTALRSFSFLESSRQQKIIVYNVSQKMAIDFVNGRNYLFVGDSDLLTNDFARNFHLKPSRILYRMNASDSLPNFSGTENYFNYNGKHIMLLDKPVSFVAQQTKPVIDLLVISKNPKVYMGKLATALDIKQVVFDGSVPAWKSNYWKKDCDSLHIPWYDVTMKGAFIMKMD